MKPGPKTEIELKFTAINGAFSYFEKRKLIEKLSSSELARYNAYAQENSRGYMPSASKTLSSTKHRVNSGTTLKQNGSITANASTTKKDTSSNANTWSQRRKMSIS